MDVRFIILLLLLVSCMPSAQVSRSNLAGSEGTANGPASGTGTGTTAIPLTDTTWNYLGAPSTSITINSANLNTAYVVGYNVETYLANSANFSGADYCLLSTFSLGGTNLELRSHIVPVSYYDFKVQRVVRVFRVDFPDVTNATSFCSGAVRKSSTTGTYVVDTAVSPSPKFDPALLCPTCTSSLNAASVRIFRKATTLDEIPSALVSLGNLRMSVDPNNNANSNVTCNTTSCKNRGYDCCLDNQCVKDGSVKPSADSLYHNQLLIAEQERLQNPLSYLSYPNLYYICGNTVPPASTGGSSGGATYDAAFELLKKDYACIQNIKSQATMTPFQSEVLSRSTPYTAATDCLTADTDSAQTMYYKNVLTRLYKTCGCAKSTLSDMITTCPAYEYHITRADASGQPKQIDCYTPPAIGNTIPLQQTVSVSSRSAPHRFFDTSGTETPLTAGSTSVQEGDAFAYLDDTKVVPDQKPFSMNAVLGQMSVTLDQALPAKVVNVEVDQVYLLSTTSGYYTPCPSCNKDSWLNTFTAFPSSNYGVGLQATGYTTARDELGTNSTTGNYEDTIFGRACWLPPTMLPYSHTPMTSVSSQRLNRLTTQAALYVNGYQRDWFGFNKGAMIGSFDGVTWFAIGKGRIVKSTSKRLFLAINAPFADLANPTIQVVNVQAYDGITQAAQVDYDPQYHQSHPYQNEAGNCQMYHMCSTDTDCVSKLGWEYMCADVRDLRTQWPVFDANGDEKSMQSAVLTIDQVLQQKKLPSSATRRCVYRGSGAACLNNVTALTDNKKKIMSCAPNFFCAPVNSAVFNSRVARYAANLEDIPTTRNHLFGKDANVLGRPLNYVSGSDSVTLPSEVSSALTQNLSNIDASASTNSGLCQPGKMLPSTSNETTLYNPFVQQQAGDPSKRADYISQIGSCNSTLFDGYRYSSCPVIGADGNYEQFGTTFPTGFTSKARAQNACGLDTLFTGISLASGADALSSYSPFRAIEGKTLNSQVIVDRSLARDACLRRAGSVCQTDLDCAPNKMHAEQVDYFSLSYFGNQAEKSYHSEFLTCSQVTEQPLASDPNYKNYDMSQNRCCRQAGLDFTTHTPNTPTSTASLSGGNYLSSYDPVSKGILLSLTPGTAPSNAKRYSRFATVEDLGATVERPYLSAYEDRNGAGVLGVYDGVNVRTKNQWKTLTEANTENCCGGGWIRKFSDGSTDWSKRDRVFFDVNNFKCINSRSILLTSPSDSAGQYGMNPQLLVDNDYGDYCKDGTNTKGSCAQYSILDSLTDTLPSATAYGTATVNTVNPNYSSSNLDYFFTPRSGDSDSQVYVDYANASGRQNITIKIPSYVPVDVTTLPISMITSTGSSTLACGPGLVVAGPTDPGNCAAGTCCYNYTPGTRILKVASTGVAAFAGQKVGVTFTFPTAGSNTPVIGRSKPGSNSFYLRRLGRMELSGIPQIGFEPLTCNDNTSRLVPGLYKTSTIGAFLNPANSYNYVDPSTGGTVYATNTYGLASDPVFSPSDFKCCTPLGKTTNSQAKCCSGFGVAANNTNTSFTCSLPPGTDLMVYFNRFVSNESVSATKGTAFEGSLIDTDFDLYTGEPLLSTTVNQKLSDLGTNFCSSKKVRQGGAFGMFEPEPQGPDTNLSSRIYNLVDSSRDNGQGSNAGTTINTGYQAFMDGFRWNHHLYCAD